MDWDFPSNNHTVIRGFNDAGIVNFAGTPYKSLVRESIQNSLDAKRDFCSDPVRVSFTQEHIPASEVPGWESLAEAMLKCENVPNNNNKQFFRDAYRLLHASSINVLKVSDFNTIGLKGSASGAEGSAWSRLVMESGTNNKGPEAGGSFGIGKSAYFACSTLRTVFFSSLSEDGEKSNIGVANLISFDLGDGEKSIGMGYYSDSKRHLAIPELADFDGCPKRDQPGTDIYILGNFIPEEKLYDELIDAVIENFLVSIIKGLLIVEIDGTVIDSAYVDEYFNKKKFLPRELLTKQMRALLDYYLILRKVYPDVIVIELDSEEYGKEFGFHDGECELFLRKGDDMNRSILVTRKMGMKLFEQKNISGSISFSGVLYISGSNMNKLFRQMEGPAHDCWKPNQQSNDFKRQEKAYDRLRDYLRKKVVENFQDKIGDEFDAFDAGQFLPDDISTDGNGNEEGEGLQNNNVRLTVKKMKPTSKKMKSPDTLKSLSEELGLSDDAGGQTGTGNNEGIGGFHSGDNAAKGERGTGDGPGGGTAPEGNGLMEPGRNGNKPDGEEEDNGLHYKEKVISKRVICLNPNSGKYKVVMVAPDKARHLKLQFSIAGEQNDFDLGVQEAVLKSATGNGRISEVKGNTVYIDNIERGERLELSVTVDFHEYCMMEVDYYESKK